MDMADSNFIANRRTLGKKNGSKNVDRNDRIVFPLRSASRPGFIPFLTSLFTDKTKTPKVYLKYWPTKVDLFWQYEY